jgi:hypothetical protein
MHLCVVTHCHIPFKWCPNKSLFSPKKLNFCDTLCSADAEQLSISHCCWVYLNYCVIC